jgi:hypothetical protein
MGCWNTLSKELETTDQSSTQSESDPVQLNSQLVRRFYRFVRWRHDCFVRKLSAQIHAINNDCSSETWKRTLP